MSEVARFIREPKQARSRESTDRALDAAVALLVERRSAAFTLAEVARAASVSMGSIYGRVAGKDDLIRAAHAREMERITNETAEAFARVALADTNVETVVSAAVRSLAELLRRNAAVMRPFMVIALDDDVVAATGEAAYEAMMTRLLDILLTVESQIARPDPRRAVSWSAAVAYGVLARELGLGSSPSDASGHPWQETVDELVAMITAYLKSPPSGP